MKTYFLTVLAFLLAVPSAQAASSQETPSIGIGNFTLTRCPYGTLHGNCVDSDKPEVVFPAKTGKPPGYAGDFHQGFLVQWEADHLLEWDKENDEPKNLTFTLGQYIWKKLIRSERALNFTFQDIALNMTLRNGTKPPDDNGNSVLAVALRGSFNSIRVVDTVPNRNYSLAVGIDSFWPMSASLYWYVTGQIERGEKRSNDKLGKKWRIGVGVGVGVGVPLLMLASYFLGQRKGKKKQQAPTAKQAAVGMN
ncbi:hypothetical protein NLG97_g4475 [Lecanicillium saksenae]|uniref:Uncharacterized protein n=1 Tax=Lecanicillium saksenae TaxID=468837 RepID=A0ACC1QV61_9HYPO|nr:hypothetical protein NLG97_g4475 [Lecanicillium saksenae]